MEFKRIINLNISGSKGLFLFGPRGVGKSYWLRKKFKQSIIYDLLKSDLFLKFSKAPQLLREELVAKKTKQPVVIDEIQKIPILLDEVHYLMENHSIRFILTGSSARKLRRGGVNLLAGRALNKKLFPLVSCEMPQLNLSKIISLGALPMVHNSNQAKSFLRSYVANYLREEIQYEGLVRRLQAFAAFLDLAGQSNAQLINYSKLASDVGVSSNTIREYFSILEDTFMGTLLPPYKKTVKRKPVSINKFYFFDIGVANTLKNRWDIARGSSEFGANFEHFIFNEINSFLNYSDDGRRLCFWRSKNHQEVDFVIGDDTAIEVKASSSIGKEDLKGLKALSEEMKLKNKIIVSFEKTSRLIEGQFLSLHYSDFLKKLWHKKF